jgi:hypothetical protein
MKIKTISVALQTAQDSKDWATFALKLAQLTRIVFTFESSNALSLKDMTLETMKETFKFFIDKSKEAEAEYEIKQFDSPTLSYLDSTAHYDESEFMKLK